MAKVVTRLTHGTLTSYSASVSFRRQDQTKSGGPLSSHQQTVFQAGLDGNGNLILNACNKGNKECC